MLAAVALVTAMMKTDPPRPYGPTPSKAQLAWHEMEFYGFLHFTTNTFTDREWGHGNESESVFDPTDFDADQIVTTAKRSGMKGLILTCKHHDGFCLWPTKTTEHNVSRSPFKKDVVKLISDACHKEGLKFGVYVSPWDRNNAHYGKPEYIEIYRQQLRELLTNYGPIFEVWHDGANGGDGYYGGAQETRKIDPISYYDWPKTWAMVRQLAPGAVIFSDVGPDLRWVGNESGFAAETSWATYSPHGPNPGQSAAPGFSAYQEGEAGHRHGKAWMPAECDVSIRPGWFWHEAENDKVKSPEILKELYFKNVGRGASFLLNVPPDRKGQLHKNDVSSLVGFRKLLDETFSQPTPRPTTLAVSNMRGGDPQYGPEKLFDNKRNTYWATDDDVMTSSVVMTYKLPVTFNTIRLREEISLGQRIDEFGLDVFKNSQWTEVIKGTSIGNCRLIQIEPETTRKVRFRIVKSAAPPCVSELSLYLDPTEAP